MTDKVLLGIDGGGTYTRVAITDMDGNLLSYVEWKGGASIYKDSRAKENVADAIKAAAEKAGCKLSDIAGAAAGIAGYDNESDLEWVRELTNIEGLKCSTQHVNDAVIAHKGALISKPGIIAISGTGSIILGITETGRHIRNYDFYHYADTAARFLSYNSVHRIIAGETDETDYELINKVCRHLQVNDLTALIKNGSEGFIQDPKERNKLFGEMASVITNAAIEGSHLAINVCNQAVSELMTGIRLVGANFDSDTVSVVLIGSVANSTFIKNNICNLLKQKSNRNYILTELVLPPVLGAVLMAVQTDKTEFNDLTLSNLMKSAQIIAEQ